MLVPVGLVVRLQSPLEQVVLFGRGRRCLLAGGAGHLVLLVGEACGDFTLVMTHLGFECERATVQHVNIYLILHMCTMAPVVCVCACMHV